MSLNRKTGHEGKGNSKQQTQATGYTKELSGGHFLGSK
ncbi:hypothetical protein NIES2104_27460 [Leptolyngbya sp. NIES-2104]|nr:hypothetical protein NIES2104_27460 [Leptolyngbya sp. NIES-2104]